MIDNLRNKKLLIGIPILKMGGTEMHSLMLARAMISVGMQVTVCCYHEYEPDVVAMFSNSGIEVRLLKLPRTSGGMSITELKKVFTFFLEEIKKIRPDFIHVQYVAPGFVPILAAWWYSSAIVTAAIHTSGSYQYGSRARFMIRAAARFCDAFVSVSNDVKKFWFGDTSAAKYGTIYNGLDNTEVERALLDLEKSAVKNRYSLLGSPLLTIVGRAGRHKGHDLLFRAVALLRSQFPGVQVAVVGEVVEKEFLENLVRELDIERNIRWLGILSRAEMLKVIASSDCLAIPSRYEGFGLTALEAMSVGIPVIASSVGGLPEIVHHKNTGLLYRSEDYEELSNAIIKLMTDAELRSRCIENGKKLMREQFSFDRFRKEWIDLFSQLAKSK